MMRRGNQKSRWKEMGKDCQNGFAESKHSANLPLLLANIFPQFEITCFCSFLGLPFQQFQSQGGKMSLKKLWPFALALVLLVGIGRDSYFATCTGSAPCNACKNCKYCKHCAKEGGKCGVPS